MKIKVHTYYNGKKQKQKTHEDFFSQKRKKNSMNQYMDKNNQCSYI